MGIHVSARELARFGYLMLHDGVWEGQQLIPQWWIELVTNFAPMHRKEDKMSGTLRYMFDLPKILNLPEGPFNTLPPVIEYDCLRTDTPIVVDGRLDEEVWQKVEWSTPFVKMDTGAPVELDSRVALLWDDDYLYAAFKYEDHDIRGTHTQRHAPVYDDDSDAQIFIDGDGDYYEVGVNPVNTVYEVFWTWMEPVVERRDYKTLDRLFRTGNFTFYFLPRKREHLGRFGERGWELPGLKCAVQVDGSLNCPEIRDHGWTVEFAFPWAGLKVLAGGRDVPPKNGDVWRIGASRCQHFHDPNGNNVYADWSWNRHGSPNMHIPERWSKVRFLDRNVLL